MGMTRSNPMAFQRGFNIAITRFAEGVERTVDYIQRCLSNIRQSSINSLMQFLFVAAKLECPNSAKLECHTPRVWNAETSRWD